MAHASAHEGNAPHVLTLLPPPPPPPQLPPPPLPRLLIRALPQTPLLQLQLLQHQPQPRLRRASTHLYMHASRRQ